MNLTRLLVPCLCALACGAARTDPAKEVAAAALEGRTVAVINDETGKCLDVANASRAAGTPVSQYTCSGDAHQLFVARAVPATQGRPEGFAFVAAHSGLCLDLRGAESGAALQQFPCHYGENQTFVLTAGGPTELAVGGGDLVLDVPYADPSDSIRVQQYPRHGGRNQRWRLWDPATLRYR